MSAVTRRDNNNAFSEQTRPTVPTPEQRLKAALRGGQTVQIQPRGHSMKGRINDGDLVTISPCDPQALQVGDIVLASLNGRDYLHLVTAREGERVQIGNTWGKINGWVAQDALYGMVTRIETPEDESVAE